MHYILDNINNINHGYKNHILIAKKKRRIEMPKFNYILP